MTEAYAAFIGIDWADEKHDVRLQLELLVKHRNRRRPLHPPSPARQALEQRGSPLLKNLACPT